MGQHSSGWRERKLPASHLWSGRSLRCLACVILLIFPASLEGSPACCPDKKAKILRRRRSQEVMRLHLKSAATESKPLLLPCGLLRNNTNWLEIQNSLVTRSRSFLGERTKISFWSLKTSNSEPESEWSYAVCWPLEDPGWEPAVLSAFGISWLSSSKTVLLLISYLTGLSLDVLTHLSFTQTYSTLTTECLLPSPRSPTMFYFVPSKCALLNQSFPLHSFSLNTVESSWIYI